MPFHSFIPGDVAKSAEVNDNFAYIMSILGPLSSPSRVKTTTEYVMGARQNFLMTGTADTGSADASGDTNEFFQMGWNADYNLSGGTWKLAKFLSTKGASLIRFGNGQITFLGTDNTTGSLEASATTWMRMKEEGSGGFIYVPHTFSFQGKNSTAGSLNDYRLMYTPISSPGVVYDGSSHEIGTIVKTATNYGVSKYAKAIAISCIIVADSSSGPCRVRFRQTRSSTSAKYGFTVTAGQGRYGSGYGIVPLGEGTDDGKFTVEFVNAVDSISAYVVGYLN